MTKPLWGHLLHTTARFSHSSEGRKAHRENEEASEAQRQRVRFHENRVHPHPLALGAGDVGGEQWVQAAFRTSLFCRCVWNEVVLSRVESLIGGLVWVTSVGACSLCWWRDGEQVKNGVGLKTEPHTHVGKYIYVDYINNICFETTPQTMSNIQMVSTACNVTEPRYPNQGQSGPFKTLQGFKCL